MYLARLFFFGMHLLAALGSLLREGKGEKFIDPPFGSSSITF